MKKYSIVIFGGSFNPPLNSHFAIAQQVLNQYKEVEKVIFVPVNKNYSKAELIDNEHRYNMLKLVVNKNNNFMVSDIDFKEDKSLSTIETLEEMKNLFPSKEIWFLTGSDNLKYFHTWNRAKELVSRYKILIMERELDIMDDIIQNNELLSEYKEHFHKLEKSIIGTYSSTYVREQVKKGKSIRYLLPDEVWEYIEKNRLYMEDKDD